MRRERIRRVAGAGCDVEGAPGRLRLRELHQSLEALALGVRLAGEIMRRRRAELLLCQRFRHIRIAPIGGGAVTPAANFVGAARKHHPTSPRRRFDSVIVQLRSPLRPSIFQACWPES